ncbi:MAG: hypothetical protein OXI53_09555 [Nitrospira sp.]|nr:hypothetical protein [Nitrospira sp.]MDE0405543.1 hypothetical protein [Nitrospira sp.]MDE0487067.1 hypothetical protein [Nitrospira sp.]
MDMKEAVRTAKKHITELFTDETITHVGLEEVEFNNSSNNWEITIGFSRPWQNISLATALSNRPPARSYKLVCINDNDGHMISVTDRVLTDSQ